MPDTGSKRALQANREEAHPDQPSETASDSVAARGECGGLARFLSERLLGVIVFSLFVIVVSVLAVVLKHQAAITSARSGSTAILTTALWRGFVIVGIMVVLMECIFQRCQPRVSRTIAGAALIGMGVYGSATPLLLPIGRSFADLLWVKLLEALILIAIHFSITLIAPPERLVDVDGCPPTPVDGR